jgi:hypothetical protein
LTFSRHGGVLRDEVLEGFHDRITLWLLEEGKDPSHDHDDGKNDPEVELCTIPDQN